MEDKDFIEEEDYLDDFEFEAEEEVVVVPEEEVKLSEHDAEMLRIISEKTDNGIELSLDELKFLYGGEPKVQKPEDEEKIRKHFNMVREKRNGNSDLKRLENYIKCGGLVVLPERFAVGCEEGLDLSWLKKGGRIYFPSTFNHSINLNNITEIGYIKLPEKLSGNLMMKRLNSVEGLMLPRSVHDLDLSGLTGDWRVTVWNAVDFPKCSQGLLVLPNTCENLTLSGITRLVGLSGFTSKYDVNSDLDEDYVFNSDYFYYDDFDCIFPSMLAEGGDLDLSGLKEIAANYVMFPGTCEGTLDMRSLTSILGTVHIQFMDTIDICSLRHIDGRLCLYECGWNGFLYCDELESLRGLYIGIHRGILSFPGIETIDRDGWKIEKVEGCLSFPNVVRIDSASICDEVGELYFGSLEYVDGLYLPKVSKDDDRVDRCSGDVYMDSLKSFRGVYLDHVDGDLYVRGLETTEGLVEGTRGKVGYKDDDGKRHGVVKVSKAIKEELDYERGKRKGTGTGGRK